MIEKFCKKDSRLIWQNIVHQRYGNVEEYTIFIVPIAPTWAIWANGASNFYEWFGIWREASSISLNCKDKEHTTRWNIKKIINILKEVEKCLIFNVLQILKNTKLWVIFTTSHSLTSYIMVLFTSQFNKMGQIYWKLANRL